MIFRRQKRKGHRKKRIQKEKDTEKKDSEGKGYRKKRIQEEKDTKRTRDRKKGYKKKRIPKEQDTERKGYGKKRIRKEKEGGEEGKGGKEGRVLIEPRLVSGLNKPFSSKLNFKTKLFLNHYEINFNHQNLLGK